MKASELLGHALDWAVAKCEGVEIVYDRMNRWLETSDPRYAEPNDPEIFSPSTYWAQGGAIIEREGISIVLDDDIDDYSWTATCIKPPYVSAEQGSTPLIAAMRCYVSSKLGEEIEIPDDLKGESK